ncbi:hypothetical protein EMCRGX_G011582 [Ephydatia muelleri]
MVRDYRSGHSRWQPATIGQQVMQGVEIDGGGVWKRHADQMTTTDVGNGIEDEPGSIAVEPEWRLDRQAPDGFDAVSVQNVGSTYIIVLWDLPTHSNGILINFSLYCNGALAGVLPLTVISYDTTGLLFTLYMYMSSSHAHRHCTPVGTWCWASSVLQPACPVMYMYTSRDISGKITHTIYPPSLPLTSLHLHLLTFPCSSSTL